MSLSSRPGIVPWRSSETRCALRCTARTLRSSPASLSSPDDSSAAIASQFFFAHAALDMLSLCSENAAQNRAPAGHRTPSQRLDRLRILDRFVFLEVRAPLYVRGRCRGAPRQASPEFCWYNLVKYSG